MKLPDFDEDPQWRRLKQSMGLEADAHAAPMSREPRDHAQLTREELDALTSGDGLDIDAHDLTALEDGTFAFKGRRVLVYIRDVADYIGHVHEPRYHVMTCARIRQMMAIGRFRRYVISVEQDGVFTITRRSGATRLRERRRLLVCQACLAGLQFDGFGWSLGATARTTIVRSFSPARFFEQFPETLHSQVPVITALDAPLDDYPPNFSAISQTLRTAAGWLCDDCGEDFSAPERRRFLHVHHLGLKYENDAMHLRVLCIACHADQPGHGHMKRLPDYQALAHRK